jgi:glycosidase
MQIQTPDWVKHAVFYQIFPDRFARSQQPRKRLLKNASWEAWEDMPTLQGYKGGDLWGILEQLDYLENLGINAVYFTPIFQSASNHRYHTHDYYQVDPMLGGKGAFRELLEACHDRNIKVVLDGVFNHASRGFFFFHDILENGPHSPWVDWFKIEAGLYLPTTANFRLIMRVGVEIERYQCSTTTIPKYGNTLWRLRNTGLNSGSTAGA